MTIFSRVHLDRCLPNADFLTLFGSRVDRIFFFETLRTSLFVVGPP